MWEKKGSPCLRESGKASGRRQYLNEVGQVGVYQVDELGEGSRHENGECKVRQQGRLGELGGGSQQRMSWKGVPAGPQPHSRQLKKKREYLAQMIEKAQSGISGLAPGICLPFLSGAGVMGTSTARLAACLPEEIKHPWSRFELVPPIPERAGSAPPGLYHLKVEGKSLRGGGGSYCLRRGGGC